MTCDDCGAELQIGDWPFCRGGHGRPSLRVSAFQAYWDRHLRTKPVYVQTPGDKERLMREWNLAPLADMPVSDGERFAFEKGRERAARQKERRA